MKSLPPLADRTVLDKSCVIYNSVVLYVMIVLAGSMLVPLSGFIGLFRTSAVDAKNQSLNRNIEQHSLIL